MGLAVNLHMLGEIPSASGLSPQGRDSTDGESCGGNCQTLTALVRLVSSTPRAQTAYATFDVRRRLDAPNKVMLV